MLAVALAAVPPACAQTPELGQLDASPTLFTVMAAINASGYDADLDSPSNHPLRKAVRAELARRNLSSLPALKQFFAKHRAPNDTAELTHYISFALTCAGPPSFAIQKRDVEIPPDARGLAELSPLLQAFYKEADIAGLWRRSQPAINQYLEIYHRPVLEAVEQANSYLRQANYGYRDIHFQVLISLLAPPNQVQLRSYGDQFTVVVTPSAEVRAFDIRHAYLVYLLDPLATRYQEILRRKEGLREHILRAAALPEAARKDFLVLTTESLVRAVESRLDHRPQMVDEALHEGYILTPYFAECLPAYEKQQVAMQGYYAGMVSAIDLVKEDTRLMKVDFRKEPTVHSVKVTGPAASASFSSAPSGTPSAATSAAPMEAGPSAASSLETAEQAYQARDLDKAKSAYMAVLQQTDDTPLHARAYYGLARVAALQKDPETAERLFQKTLDLNPAPADKAWTLVYLGKLELAASESGKLQGDTGASDTAREHAAQYFQAALGVNGASEAARAEAQKSLQAISKP